MSKRERALQFAKNIKKPIKKKSQKVPEIKPESYEINETLKLQELDDLDRDLKMLELNHKLYSEKLEDFNF